MSPSKKAPSKRTPQRRPHMPVTQFKKAPPHPSLKQNPDHSAKPQLKHKRYCQHLKLKKNRRIKRPRTDHPRPTPGIFQVPEEPITRPISPIESKEAQPESQKHKKRVRVRNKSRNNRTGPTSADIGSEIPTKKPIIADPIINTKPKQRPPPPEMQQTKSQTRRWERDQRKRK